MIRPILRQWKKLIPVLLLAGAGYAIHQQYPDAFSRENILLFGRQVPAGWFVLAFAVLPLAGFPLSPLLVIAGVRFGFGTGMLIASLGILFHHWMGFRIANGWMRDWLVRRMESWGHSIPQIGPNHQAWFTACFAAVHGPPYFAKLYLLALTGVSRRVYTAVGAPVYAFFCVIPVGAGSSVATVDVRWFYAIGILSAVILLVVFLLRRKSRKMQDACSAENLHAL
jgi:uncharacterized membrane protein YdjX (TVP38/TMEM64 family)